MPWVVDGRLVYVQKNDAENFIIYLCIYSNKKIWRDINLKTKCDFFKDTFVNVFQISLNPIHTSLKIFFLALNGYDIFTLWIADSIKSIKYINCISVNLMCFLKLFMCFAYMRKYFCIRILNYFYSKKNSTNCVVQGTFFLISFPQSTLFDFPYFWHINCINESAYPEKKVDNSIGLE